MQLEFENGSPRLNQWPIYLPGFVPKIGTTPWLSATTLEYNYAEVLVLIGTKADKCKEHQ